MAAASSVVELCTLANEKLDAATSAKFFNHGAGAGAMSSGFSWPEAERTTSRLTCRTALQALCEKCQVSADYTPISLNSCWAACHPPPEGSNAICVYADALEAGMRIPLHEFYVAVLGHYGLAPSQLAPDAWSYMAAFELLCGDAGVEPTLRAFRSFFSLCTHKGQSVGWYHFICRPYFESRSGGVTVLFAGNTMPRSDGWKSRFFHLQSPPTMPWPCAVKWGKPSRAAVRLPEVAWNDTVVKKLLERAGGSPIDVAEFLSRRSPTVVAPPRDRVRPTFTPQPRHRPVKVGAAGAAAGPQSAPTPQQQELARKRKSFSSTHAWGLVDCVAEASELAKDAMRELDEKGMELQATRREFAQLKGQVRAMRDKHAGDVAQLKEEFRVANAQHATEVRRLADEHRKASTAHGEEVKAERASVVAKLQEEHAAAAAQLTEHLNKEHAAAVARLNEEHADGVARLKEELRLVNTQHAAEVRRLADEQRKASTAHGEEAKAERASVVAKLQEEHAAAVAQLTERLNKEHTSAVARLKNEHANGIARLKEKHAAEVAKLQDDVARLKEEHAADVARVKDAADKDVQDAKKNIVLRLFPRLDVSLLEQPKVKIDPDETAN